MRVNRARASTNGVCTLFRWIGAHTHTRSDWGHDTFSSSKVIQSERERERGRVSSWWIVPLQRVINGRRSSPPPPFHCYLLARRTKTPITIMKLSDKFADKAPSCTVLLQLLVAIYGRPSLKPMRLDAYQDVCDDLALDFTFLTMMWPFLLFNLFHVPAGTLFKVAIFLFVLS